MEAFSRRCGRAARSAGLAVAFNAPIGGTLFTLEEVTRSFRVKTVLATIFAAAPLPDLIWNTLAHNLSNARSEATNTHLRALTKRAYGYHSPEALIGMAMLTRGGLCPALPGRK